MENLNQAFADELLPNIPPLPVAVRYYDDFSDCFTQLTDLNGRDRWPLRFNGHGAILDFTGFDVQHRGIIKVWCANLLATLSPRSAEFYCRVVKQVPAGQITGLLTTKPKEIRSRWNIVLSSGLTYPSIEGLKSLLSFLCAFGIGDWGSDWSDLVSQLPLPKKDKYASVRTGDVFLTVEEEVSIVQYIDEFCNRIQSSDTSISDGPLESCAILVCSYQFGMRAKQIAMLEMRNIRIWEDGIEQNPAVHLTFTMIKQRSANRVFPMVRKAKRDWSPLFIELEKRAQLKGLSGTDHVFHRTPEEVATLIADLTESILSTRRTVTDLRHTAAQRLVDAGASEEELASFMGHTDLNTGLIYFNSTPAQGARINQALGISKTYQAVVKIAHGRFIAPEELAELKGDQQVGGVPHGIPIAGIGGCSSGQPSCPFNPIMSCYGCSRFMPVTIAAIHQEVLEDLRGVMKFFYASSHGERGSPALQLERTISNVQTVLTELGEKPHELES